MSRPSCETYRRRRLVETTVETVGDVATTTFRSVGDATQAIAETAKDVVVGAVQAAEEVGTSAVTAVRGQVGTTIKGVEVPEPKKLPDE